MKRSDIILKLKKQFHSYESAENIAELALMVVEDEGMLPPTVEFKLGDKIVRDNMWEPEDEG